MPAQPGKPSALIAKLGQKLVTAHEKHKGDETKISMIGELPGGITGGVAQLIEVKFGVKDKDGEDGAKKGDYYFYAAGAVVEPKVFKDKEGNVHRIEGLRTSITEALYDTPKKAGQNARKTFDDHYAWVLNELRKLGVETKDIQPADLEPVAAELKKQQPYFKFSTWKPPKATEGPYKDKESMTFHNWAGVCQYDADASQVAAVADASGQADGGYTDQGDMDSLATLADSGDENAQVALTEMATGIGCTEDQIKNGKDWKEVVTWIKVGKPPGASPSPPVAATTEASSAPDQPDDSQVTADVAADDEWKPQITDVYGYRPYDPKTKKQVDKKTEVEVTAVDEAKKTVTLQDINKPKVTYKNVKWETLESP